MNYTTIYMYLQMTGAQLLLFVQVNSIAWGVNQTDFIIHGLWPEYYNGGWPEYCCHNITCKFNQTVISELVPNLTMWWTDFRNPQRLWSHEWYKHGTCSNYTEWDYFTMGLTMRNKFPGAQVLMASGLEKGCYYNVATFLETLTKYLNVKPALQCTGQLLEEFIMCFVIQSRQYIDCPAALNKCSKYNVYW